MSRTMKSILIAAGVVIYTIAVITLYRAYLYETDPMFRQYMDAKQQQAEKRLEAQMEKTMPSAE